MSSRLVDLDLERFTAAWRAPWRGPHRMAMLTASLADPRYFVAYGTDGSVAFQVEGAWSSDLNPFLARLKADGVELLAPPWLAPVDEEADQPTFPDPETVQRCFDAFLGKAAA